MGDRFQNVLLLVAVLVVLCGGGACYVWAHDYWDIEREQPMVGPE